MAKSDCGKKPHQAARTDFERSEYDRIFGVQVRCSCGAKVNVRDKPVKCACGKTVKTGVAL